MKIIHWMLLNYLGKLLRIRLLDRLSNKKRFLEKHFLHVYTNHFK